VSVRPRSARSDGALLGRRRPSWASNPEGDHEIYVMNASDGKGKRNLTDNGPGVIDYYPVFSPGSKKIAYHSSSKQTSNPKGDIEIYRANALDGKEEPHQQRPWRLRWRLPRLRRAGEADIE
jgi:Tol biopolymer transport system component